MNEQLPLTPYNGTSGWSGTDTSKDRAETEDTNGTTAARQSAILHYLHLRGAEGATWKDLASWLRWHHGQASGALSVLHKEGLIVRLSETRNRCKVYVHPEYVHSRNSEEHGSKKTKTCPHCGNSL